jgi:hypothetical protein
MALDFQRFVGGGWSCPKCGRPLEPVPAKVEYMGASFLVELAGCPDCRTILVDEELAGGRMLEVEKLLEDK